MSVNEVFEALDELERNPETANHLGSYLQVGPADECTRCADDVGDHHAVVGLTPLGHDLPEVDYHVCSSCIEKATALFESWYPYDPQYLTSVAFGSESWRDTDCGSCHSPISEKPTIVAFEHVSPDGFESPFAGDFLVCEDCRKQLLEQLNGVSR